MKQLVKSFYCTDDAIQWECLSSLLRDAFKERTEQGLLFSCRDFSSEDLKKHCGNSYIFISQSMDNKHCGMCVLTIGNNHGHMKYVAISPDCKHNGVASTLFLALIDKAYELGLSYVTSTTACGAQSSILWHKKMGFNIIRIGSDRITNYYSYIFRKQLKHHILWSNILFIKIYFVLMSSLVYILKKADGSYRFKILSF